jgi:hypothetical protein
MTYIVRAGGEHGTALQVVFQRENPGLIELLLEKGADPNERGASVTVLWMYD